MPTITIQGFECARCKWRWVPMRERKNRKPEVCPHCKSPYWDKPRRDAKV